MIEKSLSNGLYSVSPEVMNSFSDDPESNPFDETVEDAGDDDSSSAQAA
jgi:hypothetical protein